MSGFSFVLQSKVCCGRMNLTIKQNARQILGKIIKKETCVNDLGKIHSSLHIKMLSSSVGPC